MNVSMHSSALKLLGFAALGALATACSSKVSPGPETTVTDGLSVQDDHDLPKLPSPTLAVPDGNRLAFHLDAIGVQMYTCAASGTWTFVAPQANLYNRGGEVVAIHFKGPTWEWLEDGSTVVGAKLAAFTPDPTAIPWLLLGAASHAGEGRMTKVSYVQRLDTVGGNALAGTCSAGATANVPYTATYYFYVPSDGSDDHGGHGSAGADDDSP
jgi:Protein of unknown function (DUF3455)